MGFNSGFKALRGNVRLHERIYSFHTPTFLPSASSELLALAKTFLLRRASEAPIKHTAQMQQHRRPFHLFFLGF